MPDDFEARLRDAMRQGAAQAPVPANVEQRVLASTYGMPVRKARPVWFLPAVNAAVVVLVVAAVVGGVLLVRGGSPKSKIVGPAVPVSTTPAPSATLTTPAPSTSPTPTQTAPVGPVGGAVPVGFTPYSSTWISANDGWVLGTAPCVKAPCTSVVRTQDGGQTWQGIPAPVASLKTNQGRPEQVSTIRFADAADGWAFGGELYSTHDGGATWVKQSLGSGKTVVALESSAGLAWAVVNDCAPGSGNCANRFTVYGTAIGTDNWAPIGSPITGGDVYRPQLVVHGQDWWLNTGSIYHGVGSAAPTELATPCTTGYPGLLAVADPQHLDALCSGNGAAGSITEQLVGSTDGGARWSNSGPAFRQPSEVTGIADNAGGVLLISASSGGSLISRTSDDGRHFTTPLAPISGGVPWSDLGFTTQNQASVVLAGTAMYLSRDAGATWTATTF